MPNSKRPPDREKLTYMRRILTELDIPILESTGNCYASAQHQYQIVYGKKDSEKAGKQRIYVSRFYIRLDIYSDNISAQCPAKFCHGDESIAPSDAAKRNIIIQASNDFNAERRAQQKTQAKKTKRPIPERQRATRKYLTTNL